MSDDESTVEAEERPIPFPHSWVSTGLSLGILSVLAIVSMGMARQFISTRPINLFDISYGAVDALDEWFIANQFPMDDIIREEPQIFEGTEVHSYLYKYDVTLPVRLTADRVTKLISELMRGRGVTVVQSSASGPKQELNLTYNAHSFATIVLTERMTSLPLPAHWGGESPSPMSQPPAPATNDGPEVAMGHLSEDFEPELEKPGEGSLKVARREPATNSWSPGTPASENVPPEMNVEAQGETTQTKGRLAIIVDDGGYGGRWTETILGLNNGLTLSILPNTPQGTRLALRAQELGFEVLLHLPMENLNPTLTHPGELKTYMDEREIRSLFLRALDQVPGAVGVNNHQGSKFTSDAQALARVMESIEEYSLFFVDSRTTANTRAYEVAKNFHIPAASRSIFLDNESEPESIRKRFDQVIDIALDKGEGIAICHFRPSTAQVLEEMLPMLEARGIELVRVSELVQ